jgi:2,4-didehydro-3-deoxy-L-rhamnonate hydrolase
MQGQKVGLTSDEIKNTTSGHRPEGETMKLCRFNDDRLGLVEGDRVRDVSAALALLPVVRWPLPMGDLLIANLDKIRAEIEKIAPQAQSHAIKDVRLLSPVANPTKIIGAPSNFVKSTVSAEINFGRERVPIQGKGLFLKACSSLVGPSEDCKLRFLDRRNDPEIEVAIIIGRKGSDIPEEEALGHVAGYAIGLDMTLRGKEDASFRKSIDTYSIVGPWLVTADEVPDPDNLDLTLRVGNELRQNANTRQQVLNMAQLISWASSFYTLYPGDIIMAGTPEGLERIKPGDVMNCEISKIGAMDVRIAE